MKIKIDRSACIGSGLCVAIAPKIFDLDDEGTLIVKVSEGEELPADLKSQEALIVEAAGSCPVGAIKLVED